MKKTELDVEEKVETEGSVDVETELLIMEYQKNANPDLMTLKVLEFWGGEEWRQEEGADMRRFVRYLEEDDLVKKYQRNLRPDAETKEALETCWGLDWREDKGEEGRKCILQIIKEKRESVKPSKLRYHQELRTGLGKEWIQT